jgi:hypothetical protein
MELKLNYKLTTILKKIVLFHLLCQFLALSPGTVNAYILEGPHILYRVVKNMRAPASLSVLQNLTVHGFDDPENSSVFQETVNYQFPEQFRSDIFTDEMSKIYVFSHYDAITIINEKTSSTDDNLLDYYKDPLLFRNRQLLEDRLVFFGVDISTTSLGRFQNRLFYIIGAVYPDETLPQIWIEKESFLPTRLLVLDQSDPYLEKIVEFRYLNWMKTEKTWYPMRIETYIDNKLLQTIDATTIKLNTDYDDNFFNITHLQNMYPPVAPDPYENNETDELEDVQQSIEDLKRRFD